MNRGPCGPVLNGFGEPDIHKPLQEFISVEKVIASLSRINRVHRVHGGEKQFIPLVPSQMGVDRHVTTTGPHVADLTSLGYVYIDGKIKKEGPYGRHWLTHLRPRRGTGDRDVWRSCDG